LIVTVGSFFKSYKHRISDGISQKGVDRKYARWMIDFRLGVARVERDRAMRGLSYERKWLTTGVKCCTGLAIDPMREEALVARFSTFCRLISASARSSS